MSNPVPSVACRKPVRREAPGLIDRRIVGVAAGAALLFVAALVGVVAYVSRMPLEPQPVDAADPVAEAAPTEPIVVPEAPAPTPQKVEPPVREAPPAPIKPAIVEAPPAPAGEPIAAEFALAALTAPLPKPPAPVAPPPAMQPARLEIKRLHHLTDEDLRKQLLRMSEIALDRVPNTSANLIRLSKLAMVRTGQQPHLIPTLLTQRADLFGLPMRMGPDCQLGKDPAENLQALSIKLREVIAEAMPKRIADPRPDPVFLRRRLLEGDEWARRNWQTAAAIPTLQQMLQPENVQLRLLLVDALAQIKDQTASVALAQRALFDLSAEVRLAAVEKLNARPRAGYRQMLLSGFRYPWPPAAAHAAEALVALKDYDTVPQLKKLMSEPDPSLPFQDRNRILVREVVRVNHLNNCLLCHAVSLNPNDLVRGSIPVPGQAPASGYGGGVDSIFVRADVTYLKQDFSVPQPVDKPGAGPTMQRYDYLVRTRLAVADDTRRKPSQERMEAIRYAHARLSKD